MTSRPFPLNWAKSCASCGEWMPEDTSVCFDDEDQIVHDNCVGLPEPKPAPRCPECFMEHVGECL